MRSRNSISVWITPILFLALAGSGCSGSTAASAAAALAGSSKAVPVVSQAALTFTEVTADSLTVNWTAATETDATASTLSYLAFYVSKDPGSTRPTADTVKAGWSVVETAAVDITSTAVTGLEAGTTYYFTVLVADAAGNITVYPVTKQSTLASTVSSTVTSTDTNTATDTTPPVVADATLATSNVASTSLTLTWAAASDTVTVATDLSYQVYYSTSNLTKIADWQNSTLATQVGSATVDLTTVNITGLTAGTDYYFMVVVSDEAGNSTMYQSLSGTTESVSTTPPTPGASGALTFTGASSSGLTVEWTAATDPASTSSELIYEVYYSTTANSVRSISAIQTALKASGSTKAFSAGKVTGSTSLAITSLSASTTYAVNVIVSDPAGNQAAYVEGSFSTTSGAPAPPPTVSSGILTIAAVTQTSITLNWSAASDTVTPTASLQYGVYYSLSNNLDSISDTQTNGTLVGAYTAAMVTKTVTGLTLATTYYFQVLVRNEAGDYSMYTTTSKPTNGPSVYVFASALTQGNITSSGGTALRTKADALCDTTRIASYSATCTNSSKVHAIFSTAPSDNMANMNINYPMPAGAMVVDVVNQYKIASSWNDLVSNGPCNGVNGATCNGGALQSILSPSNDKYWSGTTTSGTFDVTNQCNTGGGPWTTNGVTANGAELDASQFPGISTWVQGFDNNCGKSLSLLCVCW